MKKRDIDKAIGVSEDRIRRLVIACDQSVWVHIKDMCARLYRIEQAMEDMPKSRKRKS